MDTQPEPKGGPVMNNTVFLCYEPNFEGTYTLFDMINLYTKYVSKSIYTDFGMWIHDMLRSGVFVEGK